MNNCPCGSGSAFEACCGPILAGAPAPTAEALMRSRYTAYVKRDYAHLGSSLSNEQRKDYSPDDARNWAERSEWLGLTIHGTSQGGVNDTTGLVDFSAKFTTQGQEQEHRETGIFNRENGRWVYAGHTEMAGTPVRREAPKVGRNDPCPCGSGKKFKKCCGGA